MKMVSRAILAGIGALALGEAALAAPPESKVIRVTFPDGSVEHIRYSGDVPPRILVIPAERPLMPVIGIRQDMHRLERMMAEMDRRMAVAMRQAAQMASQAPDGDEAVHLVGAGSLPPGTVRYSFVSTSTGGKTCSHSVRVIATGSNQPPKVERTSSGDCAETVSSGDGEANERRDVKPVTGDFRRTI